MSGFGNNCISNNTVCTHYIDNNCQDTNKQKHGWRCNTKTQHGCCCDTTYLKYILMECMKKQIPIWWILTQSKFIIPKGSWESHLYVVNISDNIAYFSLGKGEPTEYIIPLSNISWIFAIDETNSQINIKDIFDTNKLEKDPCCLSPEIAKVAKEYFNYFGSLLPYINISIKVPEIGTDLIILLFFMFIFLYENSKKLFVNNDISIVRLDGKKASEIYGIAYSIVPICAIDSFTRTFTIPESVYFNTNTPSILQKLDLENVRNQIKGKTLNEIIEIVKQIV